MTLLHYLKIVSIATPDEISDDEFELLAFFLVRLYSKTCNAKEVNEARRIPFSRDNKVIPPTNIPPTKRALRQHVFRSVLQSSKYRQSSYYKSVSRTTTTYKVENKMKNLLNTSFL